MNNVQLIKQIYNDPRHPGSYGGVQTIYRALDGKVSVEDIKKYLQGENTYTLHKPVRRQFSRNRVMVSGINQNWQADLVDMRHLADENDGYHYLLTCIDIFSKYAWVVPLLKKTGQAIVAAFKIIFRDHTPLKLSSDSGGEFVNNTFQSYLKSQNVLFFATSNETKASVVERFNRTFKTKMYKYFTFKNTHRYIDVLDDLIYSYNHTYHRSIKTKPVDVTKENEKEIWNTLYENSIKIKKVLYKFEIGDTVRISKTKLTFEKGYEKNWSEELFYVIERIARTPPVYRIKDLMDEEIKGTFYAEELQKVKKSNHFPIEKILRKRKKNNKIEYLVKFKGYPEKFNSWILSTDMVTI